MKKIIYVTGANGFIGQSLVNFLSTEGYHVYALLRPNSIPAFTLNQNVQVVHGDLTDLESLKRTIPKSSVVVNLAANPYHPTLSYLVNTAGTAKLIAASKVNKVSKLIHISSQATKIKKQGVYAITKNQSDELVRQSGLNWIILKPSLVYGEGERGLFNKIKSLASLLPYVPVFGDGETKIYPIEVGDLAHIIEQVILDNASNSSEFDVGSRAAITYNTLYKTITKTKLVHVPVWMGLLLSKVFSVLPNPPIYRDNVLGSTQDTNCKPNPILKRYNFSPMSFAVGSAKVLKPKKIKIAIAGLGKMGTLHMSILNTFREVEIVALIDTNVALYNTVKSMGISGDFYTSLDDACRAQAIDAVYIITPTFTHLDLIKTAIKNDLHVFVEKPVTLNADQLAQLRKIKTNKIIHAGYTLLNNRIYAEVERIIKSRTYGDVTGFTGRFEHGEVFGAKQGWMFNKKLSGGGVLMNPGPHFFSLLNLFFGKPKNIKAVIKNIYSPDLDDEVSATLVYPNFSGNVFLSWSVAKRDVAQNKFEITFEKALLKTDGQEIVITQGKKVTKIEPSQIKPKMTSIFNLNPKANGEAYYIENRSFIDAILGDRKTVPNKLETALDIESALFETYKNCRVEVAK